MVNTVVAAAVYVAACTAVAFYVVSIASIWRAGSRARDAARELEAQNALRRAELNEIEAELAALRASNAHQENLLVVMRLCREKAMVGEFASDVFAVDLAEESGQSLEVVFEALDALYGQCPDDLRDTFFGKF